MAWKVVIHRSVRKFERRHPEYKGVIAKAVSELAEDPYIGTRLKGKCSWLWKLRKGNLRVIYEVRASSKTVYVWRVGLRENIYEGLC